ncbi:MAG: preprotein translocase subunit SecE [Candidatus Omnitrophota bacterium]
MFAKIKKFVTEVKVELSKVSWSTKDELKASTMIIIISTAFLAIYIGILDLTFSKALSLMIKR